MTRIQPSTMQLVDIFCETVNAGIARWSHRPKSQWQVSGGHGNRIYGGVVRKLETGLKRNGYTPDQIKIAVQDAKDLAKLQRDAEVDE